MSAKYDKADVKYIDDAGRAAKERCGICYWWQGENACSMVEGRIMPIGWCMKFADKRKVAGWRD